MAQTISTVQKPITVGIDGSDDALNATRWSARYAARAGAPLRLVHAAVVPEWLGTLVPSSDSPGDNLSHEMYLRGGRFLDAAADTAALVAPRVSVETRLVRGAAHDVLGAESTQSQILVVGTSSSGTRRVVPYGVGTVAMSSRARCPVVLHLGRRRDADMATRSVIVGVDESDSADGALVAALEFADTMAQPVTIAHTYRVSKGELGKFNNGFLDWDRFQAGREHWLHNLVQPYRDKFPDVDITTVCLNADPVNTLVSLAETGDLIVVGSRGPDRHDGAYGPSVSHDLIGHASCSVMVVH